MNRKEIEKKILEMSSKKINQKEIAKMFNMSERTVRRILNKNNASRYYEIPNSVELKIIELYESGLCKENIAKKMKISIASVSKILSRNRVPGVEFEVKEKTIIKINDLISTHLLCFCEDLELLAKRLAIEIIYQKPEKIIVPKRLQAAIRTEKMSKIINILNRVDLNCNLEYAKN